MLRTAHSSKLSQMTTSYVTNSQHNLRVNNFSLQIQAISHYNVANYPTHCMPLLAMGIGGAGGIPLVNGSSPLAYVVLNLSSLRACSPLSIPFGL